MPLNIDWKQILLHLFNFVLLFAILFFLLYKPVKKFMDKRVEYYKNMDAEATKKSEDAEELKKTYEEKLSAVDEEIAAKRDEARATAEKERLRIKAETQKQAEEILKQARADGEAEKRKIIDGARDEIAGIVTDACEKLMISGEPSDVMDGFLSQVGGKDE